MKNLLKLISLILFVIIFYSCNKVIPSIYTKKCVELTREVYESSLLKLRTTHEYDDKLNKIKRTVFDGKGNILEIYVFQNQYDNNDRLVKVIGILQGKEKDIDTYEYYENGNIKKKMRFDIDLNETDFCEYNSSGKETKCKLEDNGSVIERLSTYDLKNNLLTRKDFLNNKIESSYEGIYNSDFLLVKTIDTSFYKNTTYYTNYIYDSTLKLVERNGNFLGVELFFYDNNNRKVKTTLNRNQKSTYKKFEYDNSGNLIKILHSIDGINLIIEKEITYFGNNKQKSVKNSTFQTNSTVLKRETNGFEYDENGNILQAYDYTDYGSGYIKVVNNITYQCN